ncbi:hypothetical protein [uncultured Wocania sp.]|uniref:DUF5018-related domain-containing protein n=1 Tax=uncultured Wocania sp. TaxID=2834404 RepID=UPI0030FA22CD
MKNTFNKIEKMKIKYLILIVLMLPLTLTSCLKSDLEDLPEFDLKDIVGVQRVEYRYVSDEVSPVDGEKVVKFVTLSHSTTIDDTTNKVTLQVSVPAASENFSETERNNVSKSNIAVMVSISTAAIIKPVGDAPLLGVPGDWSAPNSYTVWAADGTSKNWTIEVENLSL